MVNGRHIEIQIAGSIEQTRAQKKTKESTMYLFLSSHFGVRQQIDNPDSAL